ncbi:DUF3168 domain-containing protein [Sphingomonas sp. CGMCC 1.13654]|uniref:DUF3168 domain-containing protein n=1 Tax=Sphingomonas chungangi TaxID=2683589 RepID=A0A838L0G6_9SPHN|nr:DUF3168 domain-containing protein [Sphingomonas chungangi]MBA2932983.1 DUF3168 domain-containing protein [Sphingomonas chungangi]MVW56603.1 DUF3168 domain-containing protein [Sphingomonas chungangi]
MSTAAEALQCALVATLRAASFDVTGIYDGPPADAVCPYIAVSDGSTTDWSHKTGRGREHRLSIAIWDDGATPARLHALLGQTQDMIEAMSHDLDGHRIASLVFLRARIVRDPDGPWAGRLDYRVRTLEN